MLTVILILVLGGATSVVVLWLVEEPSRGRGRADRGSLRNGRGTVTPPAGSTPRRARIPSDRTAPHPVIGPGGPAPLQTRLDPTDLPPADFVAVEGPYAEVGRAPRWRQALSSASLAVIIVLLGIALAAVVGGVIGIAAELLDGAIG